MSFSYKLGYAAGYYFGWFGTTLVNFINFIVFPQPKGF
jgi:hypothetical protein